MSTEKKDVPKSPEEPHEFKIPPNDEIPQEVRCGYGPCKPACIQGWNRPVALLACLCWYTFTHSFMVTGMISVNMTTIERRFQLSSTQLAWISSSYDIVAGIMSGVFGYIGIFLHQGRLLAMSSLFLAVGGIIMFLPYVVAGIYEMGMGTTMLCDLSGNVTECVAADPNVSNNLYIFILGQVLNGVGGSALYILGGPYLDSNIRIVNTPLYLGVMTSFAAIGPAVAYTVGAYFLSIYVDFLRVDEDEILIEPDDPRWVGAWWIGFLIGSVMALIVSLLMCLWPKELPTAEVYRSERQSQAHKGIGEKETQDERFGRSWKDLKLSLKIVLTNPIWVLTTISGVVQIGTIVAFAAFLPKLMQYQFSLTPGQAAGAAGVVVVPGAAGGFIIGGLIPKCFSARTRGYIIQCIICNAIVAALAPIFSIRCDNLAIAGVTVDYFDSSNWIDEAHIDDACNENCSCTTTAYEPVCGTDGLTYFSPCYAGCLHGELDQDDSGIYTDCSCVNHTTTESTFHAEDGVCSGDCVTELVVFLILFLIVMLAVFIGNTAGQALILRVIPDKERALSYGLSLLFIRLCGNVPIPILFGVIFDSACLIWQEECDEQGACWIYDSESLSWGFMWAAFSVGIICLVCFILIMFLYKPPPPETEELIIGEDEVKTAKDSDVEVPAVVDEATDGIVVGANGEVPGVGSDVSTILLGLLSEDNYNTWI